jgi:hypothetical protein
MDEYKIVLQNLERLRTNYGLEYDEVDKFGNLKADTYKKIIIGKIILNLIELISIAKIYIPEPSKVFNPKMRMPAFKDLSPVIQEIASERLGKMEKVIEKKDLIYYCILIFNRHFKVGTDFTNSQIKGYLNEELKEVFKYKSIEWNKSIISECIFDTKTTQPGKTKPENIYKLIKNIPADMVKKAREKVGDEWLED